MCRGQGLPWVFSSIAQPCLLLLLYYMCTYAWCVVSGGKGKCFGVSVLHPLVYGFWGSVSGSAFTHSAILPALALKPSLSLNLEVRDPLVSEPPVLGDVYRL